MSSEKQLHALKIHILMSTVTKIMKACLETDCNKQKLLAA